MTAIEQVPWELWLALAVALLAVGLLLRRRVTPDHPLVPFGLGMLLGALLAFTLATSTQSRQPSAPRPSPVIRSDPSGLVAPGRTAAPMQGVTPAETASRERDVARATVQVPDHKPSGTITHRAVEIAPQPAQDGLRGVASWFAAPAGTAAAGPALRAALGRGWRGSVIRLCGPAGCARVTLSDWMRRDRLVDLNRAAFTAVCGPLSMGVCRVTASR